MPDATGGLGLSPEHDEVTGDVVDVGIGVWHIDVPEPESLALMLLGMLGLAGASMRRRRLAEAL